MVSETRLIGSVIWKFSTGKSNGAGSIVPGQVITGSYTYEACALDSNSAPTVGDYWHHEAPYGITVPHRVQ